MACSLCGQDAPINGSIEYFGPKQHLQLELCVWCDARVSAVLTTAPPVTVDVDDINVELRHHPSCCCDECDPDFMRERRRDNALA